MIVLGNILNPDLMLIVAIAVWELIWKGLALWVAAKNDQKYWFAALLFINTAGVLSIAYLLYQYGKSNKIGFHLGRQ